MNVSTTYGVPEMRQVLILPNPSSGMKFHHEGSRSSIAYRIVLARLRRMKLWKLLRPSQWLVLGGLVFWFFFLRPVMLGGPASYIIVSVNSMEPRLSNGDLAILHRRTNYDVGDVVAFTVRGSLVIHRIVGASEDSFIMQGDNRSDADFWKPGSDEILSRLWFKIPSGGRVVTYLRRPYVLGAIAGMISAFYVLGESPKGEATAKRRAADRVTVPTRSRALDPSHRTERRRIMAAERPGTKAIGTRNRATPARTVAPVFGVRPHDARMTTHQLMTWTRVDGRMKLRRPLSKGTTVNLILKGAKSECKIVRGSSPRDEVLYGV